MSDGLIGLTALIVANYAGNNRIPVNDIPGLLKGVHAALAKLGQPVEEPAPASPVAATTGRKSLSDPSRIISMVDGKPYASLTRNLKEHGYTPASYRQACNLPGDYPMVAPAYSDKRRDLAKQFRLGRKKTAEPASTPNAVRKPRTGKQK